MSRGNPHISAPHEDDYPLDYERPHSGSDGSKREQT